MHGFEIRTGAQEWETCQASTSGNADHVCILLFYLLLCRTCSPHKQDCITQGEGKDQFLPFFNLPFCRLRWYLEGRSSGRDVFLPSAVSGGCGCIPDQLIATSSLIHPHLPHLRFAPHQCFSGSLVAIMRRWPEPQHCPCPALCSESPGSEAGALPQGRCAGCVWDGVSSWASVPAPEMGTASPVPGAHLTCSGHLQALPTQFSPSSW